MMCFLFVLSLIQTSFANVEEPGTAVKNQTVRATMASHSEKELVKKLAIEELKGDGFFPDYDWSGYSSYVESVKPITNGKEYVTFHSIHLKRHYQPTDEDEALQITPGVFQCYFVVTQNNQDPKNELKVVPKSCSLTMFDKVYDDHCCQGGGVVDSNYCFDSHEEAKAYCAK